MSKSNALKRKVGRHIREARIAKDISMAELARRLGKPRSTVHGWEHGNHGPRMSDMTDIARQLDTTVADLFGA